MQRPAVSTWIRIPADCPIDVSRNADGDVEVTLGGHRDGVELVFAPVAMERLLQRAHNALMESPASAHSLRRALRPAIV